MWRCKALPDVQVSIHAPAWGATSEKDIYIQIYKRFNPRARVGRDLCPSYHIGNHQSFNPRARVGRDVLLTARLNVAVGFNPRARVGRDVLLTARLNVAVGFNPRARVGRDKVKKIKAPKGLEFQSTRPRGARHQQYQYR